MIGLVLVCWDGTRSAGPPSSHLDKRPAPVECRGMPAREKPEKRNGRIGEKDKRWGKERERERDGRVNEE